LLAHHAAPFWVAGSVRNSPECGSSHAILEV
jgi:hypothetical protein